MDKREEVGPIHWQMLDDLMSIGHIRGYVVVVRGILLPLGDPRANPECG